DILRLYREQGRSRGIRIDWTRCDAVPSQSLDANLMEQALLNIVKNAMEAVDATNKETETGGGYVHLELVREEDKVRLSIIDSGDRLGEVPAGQIFTPFFTTKKGGQGIGLLFVREVLNRHGFPYRLAATGQGETRFDIWFAEPS
ncbi:MAG: ATP-binding protein, partial [Lysobacter sp.]